jgi:hypothetical protein
MDQYTLNKKKIKAHPKKAYTKPILTQVHLAADEAVLALCKTGSALGLNDCFLQGMTCISSATS